MTFTIMTSKTIDEAEFERRFGRKPQNDDLDRVNCTSPGKIGHFMCGVCEHDRPCFECPVCFVRRMLDLTK